MTRKELCELKEFFAEWSRPIQVYEEEKEQVHEACTEKNGQNYEVDEDRYLWNLRFIRALFNNNWTILQILFC